MNLFYKILATRKGFFHRDSYFLYTQKNGLICFFFRRFLKISFRQVKKIKTRKHTMELIGSNLEPINFFSKIKAKFKTR